MLCNDLGGWKGDGGWEGAQEGGDTCIHIADAGASQVAVLVKNLPVDAGDISNSGSILGSGRSPRGGHGKQFQDSCLENPMDREAWRTIVHRVTKNQT